MEWFDTFFLAIQMSLSSKCRYCRYQFSWNFPFKSLFHTGLRRHPTSYIVMRDRKWVQLCTVHRPNTGRSQNRSVAEQIDCEIIPYLLTLQNPAQNQLMVYVQRFNLSVFWRPPPCIYVGFPEFFGTKQWTMLVIFGPSISLASNICSWSCYLAFTVTLSWATFSCWIFQHPAQVHVRCSCFLVLMELRCCR